MPNTNFLIPNMVGGELSPHMAARTDLGVYKKGMALVQNFICFPEGGARFRNGTSMVKMTKSNGKGRLIPFQFSDEQSYIIEATDQKFRFYKDNSGITDTAKNITGITQATPAVVTSNAHGFSNGDEVYIESVGGMTELNGRFFIVAGAAANTFQLNDQFGTQINSTNYGAYTSGGTAAKVYEISTPYAQADLAQVMFAQNADTMYLVHPDYEPRKLTRSGHANWTLATFVRTADPFSAPNWPGAVVFSDSGRLMYGYTADSPETIWGSKAPTTGTPAYDDFTTGTNPTDAFIFTLVPLHGKVDAIQFLANTGKFFIVGAFGAIRRLFGATESEAITPTGINAKSINSLGVAKSMPVSNGEALFYIQRDGKTIRSIAYDITADGYVTNDRTLVANHLTRGGLVELVEQQGRPDIVWTVRQDGKFLGLTYRDQEDISGWHQHYLGGEHVNDSGVTKIFAKVLSCGIMPRPNDTDQLWFLVERKIGSNTVRTVEFMNDEPIYPIRSDFYSGDESADDAAYDNALYEIQKDAIHLDGALTYDGSAYGSAASATLTPGAVTGTGITFTASAAVFTSNMVGRQLWKKYDSNGDGGGRATITGFTDTTHVVCEITSDFDTTTAIPAGDWFLTTDEIRGLGPHLEGRVFSAIGDGGILQDVTVTNGVIELEKPVSKCHIGFKYNGVLMTLNIDTGGVTGSAQHKVRNLTKAAFNFLNTGGVYFGTRIYETTRIAFRSSVHTGRPTPLFTGIKEKLYSDHWTSDGKRLVVHQNVPLPCTVLAMDAYVETTDE